jgi:lipoprotein-releasing system permease protein
VSLLLTIALTHVRARTRQTVVSVLGVTLGVGFSIAMAALMEGSQADFIERIVDATPHIVVRDEFREPPLQPVELARAGAAVELKGQKPKEELRGIRNPKARLNMLREAPGAAVSQVLSGQVVIRHGGKDVAATLDGIEPRYERRVSDIDDDMVEGQLDDLFGAANGVVVGRGLARKLAAELGSTLTVSSSAGQILKMKVVGIFHTGVVAMDNNHAFALLKKVQVLLNRPNVVNQFRLRLDDARDARAVAGRLEERIGYRAESWEEANEGFLEVLEIRNIIMYTTVGSILVVAGFGIFNIVSTITYEKARDIAILKSLGFREGDVRVIFLAEGLAIGSTGVVLGWLFGYGLCRLLSAIPIQLAHLTEMTGLPLMYAPLHYAIAGGTALFAAAVAGYLPARRAARMNPVDIIRGAT